jgi:tryptophan synthase alpha chain
MGYLNPVMQYGIEKFCNKCKEIGIDGTIIPDLPLDEYVDEYRHIFAGCGLENIFMVTPQTSDERIRLIDSLTDSFIYIVSSSATTGAKSSIADKQKDYFARLSAMELKNPMLVGFGISNNETFREACKHTSGAIIGSAFVTALSAGRANLPEAISNFVKFIKG